MPSRTVIRATVFDGTGHRGAWGFGTGVDGLAGVVSNAIIAQPNDFFASHAHPYETDQYEAVTTGHAQELQDPPATVADRLLARLRAASVATALDG